ncbi:hypothetical protein Z947_1594 [Sulfitobacter geojensis]|nr:hypothetical protein Z947_1594 [Sulfitobacter geojensis]
MNFSDVPKIEDIADEINLFRAAAFQKIEDVLRFAASGP